MTTSRTPAESIELLAQNVDAKNQISRDKIAEVLGCQGRVLGGFLGSSVRFGKLKKIDATTYEVISAKKPRKRPRKKAPQKRVDVNKVGIDMSTLEKQASRYELARAEYQANAKELAQLERKEKALKSKQAKLKDRLGNQTLKRAASKVARIYKILRS